MIVWIKNIPPVQFSANFFEMENGDVAITLEKFPRARDRGGRIEIKGGGSVTKK